MPMKKWFRRIQPTPLYVVLAISLVYFSTGLVISHTTHSLTLLMVSYHMLCNIIALAGCIITITHGKKKSLREEVRQENSGNVKPVEVNSIKFQERGDFCPKDAVMVSTISKGNLATQEECPDLLNSKISVTHANQESKLKNTFGWARIDIIVMLICCVFLASLSFSLIVEAVQTLLHIDHQDEMHQPLLVLCLGLASIGVNLICYILIGGYTFHQGSFLYLTESGEVVLDRVVTTDQSVLKGQRRLSRSRTIPAPHTRQRQGCKEMARDMIGSVIVIITSLLVHFLHEDIGKFIDPALSIISSVILMILSYPYMRESCLILLQTIPDTINIEIIKKELLEHFPDILNVHDFHVWQLTTTKVISTIHIIFQNPRVYSKIISDINEFFAEQGVTQLTVQPEFYTKSVSRESLNMEIHSPLCLMKCKSEGCLSSHCCPIQDPSVKKSKSKEAITSTHSLESVQVENKELAAAKKSRSKSADNCSKIDDGRLCQMVNVKKVNLKTVDTNVQCNKSINEVNEQEMSEIHNKDIEKNVMHIMETQEVDSRQLTLTKVAVENVEKSEIPAS